MSVETVDNDQSEEALAADSKADAIAAFVLICIAVASVVYFVAT